MNVFIIKPSVAYSGGCALVAANSANEAEILYKDDEARAFDFELYEFKIENSYDLTCNTDKPKIILDTIYIE